jgi:hypothetical protein
MRSPLLFEYQVERFALFDHAEIGPRPGFDGGETILQRHHFRTQDAVALALQLGAPLLVVNSILEMSSSEVAHVTEPEFVLQRTKDNE